MSFTKVSINHVILEFLSYMTGIRSFLSPFLMLLTAYDQFSLWTNT